MVKKLLTLLLMAALTITVLASCTFDLSGLTGGGTTEQPGEEQGGNGGGNGGNENEENIENLIYNSTSELSIVVGEGVDGELALDVSNAIFNARGNVARMVDPTAEKAEHEIVIGATSREITSLAMKRMNREAEMKLSEDEMFYAIYSDGSSIAIVFEDDYEGVAQKLAIEYFIEEYLTDDTLAVAAGDVEVKSFDILEDYYIPLDDEHKAKLWAQAEEKVGKATVQALQSLASLYTFDLVSWMANLYDPCICVCVGMGEETCQNTKYCRAQGGGFYFSNSARDSVGYLPDLESTRQAMDLLNMSGMTWQYGGNYYSGAVPTEMLEAIGRYTQVLQCEDGYFRHPQWSNIADFDMRLNRDLSWATTLLNAAKMSPFYTTPTGIAGIGVPEKYMSAPIGADKESSTAVAVSKVIAAAAPYPAVLESEKTWGEFLASLDGTIRTNSYGNGSKLSTYNSQIQARDRQIGTADNPRPLMTMTINWLNSHMNPERGTWVGDETYGGNPAQIGSYAETNGVMKICGLYSGAKAAWPNGLIAMQTCMDNLTTDEKAGAGVDVYNAWIALNGVYGCVSKYNSPEEQEAAKELMQNFRQNATDAVLASRDKLATFKRADGSFSYSPTGGSGVSMGMPTQVKGTSEGDVNGALIASVDSWGHICSGVGITKVPIFGAAELYKYRKIIESSNPVRKQGASLDYTMVDFEDEEVGEEPAGVSTTANPSPDTTYTVRYDDANRNTYLEFVSKPVTTTAAGNQVSVKCESLSPSATAFVFEGDICLAETSNSGANFQINMGSINYFIRGMVSGSKLKLVEMSSDVASHSIDMDLGVDIDVGDWFRLKIVYYPGDHDTVRIKVYFANLTDGDTDVRLIAVSDNYWDQYGNKNAGKGKPGTAYTGTSIYCLKNFNGTILLDNLAAYKTKDTYTAESDPNNQPPYNVDPPEVPRKVYDFEDGLIDEDITVDGAPEVKGGELAIASKTTISVPINNTKIGGKCATASFDLGCVDAAKGDLFTMSISEPIGKLFTLVFTVESDESGKYITCYEKAESNGAVLSTIKIPVGESVNVQVDYHHNEDVALIYVDGEFIAASNFIYSSANKRTARTLTITTSASDYEMTLDNIIFERNLNSYAEATEPKKNSVLHTFEENTDGVTLDGSAKRDWNGASTSYAVSLGQSKGALTVPVNHRANIFTVVTLNAELYFTQSANNGETHTVKFIDNDGTVIFAIAIKINGKMLEIYEVGHDGTASSPIASVDKAGKILLGVELYQEQKIANIYVSGVCVAKSSVFVTPEAYDNVPMTAEIATSNAKSLVFIDNVKVESLYKIYEKATVSGTVDNEDSSNPVTFDSSSTGSVPKGLVNNGTNFRIENVYNDITEEYSNVGVLDTIRGRNESIGVKTDKANLQSCVTFQVDFKIENPEYDHIAQIFLTEGGSVPGSCLYGMVFQKTSATTFKISDYTSAGTKNNFTISGLNFGTWYRLKVEFYVDSDTGEARIMVYLNDQLKYVSANHYREGQTATNHVKEAFFYTFLDSKCQVYVDNMSLTSSDATCNDTVGSK